MAVAIRTALTMVSYQEEEPGSGQQKTRQGSEVIGDHDSSEEALTKRGWPWRAAVFTGHKLMVPP